MIGFGRGVSIMIGGAFLDGIVGRGLMTVGFLMTMGLSLIALGGSGTSGMGKIGFPGEGPGPPFNPDDEAPGVESGPYGPLCP
jgi:hypothetical protein